ncbi:nitroreductase family deazaflavin-dependent oxidoreductase [Microbacterium sp.]|uniref:nitroreductase family deazaflavin-dependent oxidoreductase n=1 Tax=Microbacterium sp. TaxID=51671 RepID=UPI003A876C33
MRTVEAVRRAVAPMTRMRVFRWLGPRILPALEGALGAVTGHRVQVSALLVPSFVLVTRGARSGREREAPLMYTPDGHGRAIVAGTSFARSRHPDWTYNLIAHPRAEIVVRGRRWSVVADLIADGDREAAWRSIEAQWPGYRAYERDSGRVVRLFLLQPVAGPFPARDRRARRR